MSIHYPNVLSPQLLDPNYSSPPHSFLPNSRRLKKKKMKNKQEHWDIICIIQHLCLGGCTAPNTIDESARSLCAINSDIPSSTTSWSTHSRIGKVVKTNISSVSSIDWSVRKLCGISGETGNRFGEKPLIVDAFVLLNTRCFPRKRLEATTWEICNTSREIGNL